MLEVLSLVLFFFSSMFTSFWRSSIWGEGPPNMRYTKIIEYVRWISQRISIVLTTLCFGLTLLFGSAGWQSFWGVFAVIFAIWTVVYFIVCYKTGVSPLEGKILHNKFYNFMVTEVPFSYLYVFTWIQLLIIIWGMYGYE